MLILSRILSNVTDLISSTHVVRLLVGLLVVQVHFGRFSMISTGRFCETWSQDLMRLGLNDSHRILISQGFSFGEEKLVAP